MQPQVRGHLYSKDTRLCPKGVPVFLLALTRVFIVVAIVA